MTKLKMAKIIEVNNRTLIEISGIKYFVKRSKICKIIGCGKNIMARGYVQNIITQRDI
jgi:hypothetical protein